MNIKKIDINADLGEGFLFDEELMQQISSCNIACGGHAGTENSIRATVRLAKKYGVTIGAHPSYPDPDNFGRKEMEITPSQLQKSIREQITSFINIAKQEGAIVRYVKPHGALYNKAAKDPITAQLLVDVIKEIEPSVALLGLSNSLLEDVAKKNYLLFLKESFADRRYHAKGTLVSRANPKGVIHQKEVVWKQVKSIVLDKELETIEGEKIKIEVDSICFHGDTPEALELLSYVCEQLTENQITIQNAI
ncbi:5-oxoprolinase subunit PxpA [Ochrovirga pacifica]|uniref:5-oxoprolinase subunit PxpA n=1 Tax=Ochrovirga pacifica TaxID=1042376 RepID=UPI0002559B42|nr:5-oxoprolinase subunit PxpA [Ochrovirga pacifica]